MFNSRHSTSENRERYFFYTNEFQKVFQIQSCFKNDKQEEVRVSIETDVEAPPAEEGLVEAAEGGLRAFLRRLLSR